MDRQLQEFRDQVDVNCGDLATRIGRLETNRRRTTEEEILETAVGHPDESKFNPTIQLTLMLSIARALKSMLLPSRAFGPSGLHRLAVGYELLFLLA